MDTYSEEPDKVLYDSSKRSNVEEVTLSVTKTEKTHDYFFIDSTHFKELHGIDPRYAPSEVVRKYVHEREGFSVLASNDSSRLVEREVTHTVTSCPAELKLPEA